MQRYSWFNLFFDFCSKRGSYSTFVVHVLLKQSHSWPCHLKKSLSVMSLNSKLISCISKMICPEFWIFESIIVTVFHIFEECRSSWFSNQLSVWRHLQIFLCTIFCKELQNPQLSLLQLLLLLPCTHFFFIRDMWKDLVLESLIIRTGVP